MPKEFLAMVEVFLTDKKSKYPDKSDHYEPYLCLGMTALARFFSKSDARGKCKEKAREERQGVSTGKLWLLEDSFYLHYHCSRGSSPRNLHKFGNYMLWFWILLLSLSWWTFMALAKRKWSLGDPLHHIWRTDLFVSVRGLGFFRWAWMRMFWGTWFFH